MSSDLNRVTIIGRLTRDPELKQTKSGKAVTSFSIGNTTGWGDNEKSNFFTVVAWQKTAEIVCQYMKKGSKIGVDGRLEYRSWEDDNGLKRSTVEIVADSIQFLDSVASGQQKESVASGQQDSPFDDSQVPF